MRYMTNSDLPSSIKNHLPEHAQTVYRQVFNGAHEDYKNEVTAHKIAWAAVERRYEKQEDGTWVEKGTLKLS